MGLQQWEGVSEVFGLLGESEVFGLWKVFLMNEGNLVFGGESWVFRKNGVVVMVVMSWT